MKVTAMNDPGPPDQPSDHEDDLRDVPVVPRAEDTDDDEWGDSDDGDAGDDRNGVDGYQLLPQNLDPPQTDEHQDSDDSMSNDDTDVSSFRNFGVVNSDASFETEALRNFSTGEARERAEIFSRSVESGSRREIELGSEKLSAIQTAMAKISLPPSSVPVWANKMSDEEWNRLIQDRLGSQPRPEIQASGRLPSTSTEPSTGSPEPQQASCEPES